jgi:hypothetical protein
LGTVPRVCEGMVVCWVLCGFSGERAGNDS